MPQLWQSLLFSFVILIFLYVLFILLLFILFFILCTSDSFAHRHSFPTFFPSHFPNPLFSSLPSSPVCPSPFSLPYPASSYLFLLPSSLASVLFLFFLFFSIYVFSSILSCPICFVCPSPCLFLSFPTLTSHLFSSSLSLLVPVLLIPSILV